MKPLRFFLLLNLIAIALLSAGCVTDNQVISQAQQFHGGLQPAVMDDPELSAYLQQVGDRIISAAKELDAQGYGPPTHRQADSSWMFGSNMKFHFVNSKTLNAFTTGGDHMYIYNELFQQCKSEDELAAVMSHEYGHVYDRHVQKGINRQMGFMGLGVAAGALGSLVGGREHGEAYAGTASGAAAMLSQVGGAYYTR